MLKVIPKAWSYTFSVTEGAEPIAQVIDLSWWGDKGELQVQGNKYLARRDKSTYVLESAAGVLVRAERPRSMFRELVIEYAGHSYTLRAKSSLRRQFLMFDGPTQIGSVTPEGLFTRKAAVDLPTAFPLFLQVFVVWLAMTLWKEGDVGAVAGGAVVAS